MSKKILIVDDEQDMVEMLELRFQGSGYEVVTANNGLDGLEKAKETSPDLIISDEMMPKMDGYKMSGLLKSDTRFKDTPIIMFTARAEEEDSNMSKEVGIDAYATKLIDFEDLLLKVQELLGESPS